VFRNLILFRLSPRATQACLPLDDKLAEMTLRPIGPLEMSVHGFVSPFGEGKAITHEVSQCTLLTLGGEHRLLPAAVVNEALRKRVVEIEQREDRKVGRKERKSLKDEVIIDLMPRAFVKPSRQSAYLDASTGWLVIDTGSIKPAENLVSQMREAIGEFPATPATPEESVRALMTEWVTHNKPPEGLVIGDACELKDPAGTPTPTARVRNQDLNSDEVREHLKAGKQVSQLALVYQERLSFTLTDELVIKGIKMLDVSADSAAEDASEGEEGKLDAEFALMILEFRNFFQSLEDWFRISRPED